MSTVSLLAPALAQSATVGDVTSLVPIPDGVEVHAGTASMRITALRDDVLRVRLTAGDSFPEDASWAVLPAARTARVDVSPTPTGFRTSQLQVVVERSPLRLLIEDGGGNILSEDAPGLATEFRGTRTPQGQPFHIYKTLHADEHIFGLGDKTGPLDRRGEVFADWNTDSFAFQESTDPIYKSIPYYLGETGGRYYGFFLDNTWRAVFDFGKTERNTTSISADGGPIDYYFLAGPKPAHVIESYAWLTGLPPLPPLWSLGFQQSRFTYAPAARLQGIANRLRADKIPADALWLDIDLQDQYRPFTIDPRAFPDMPKLLAGLRAQHFHVIAITDLHIAVVPHGYQPYTTGSEPVFGGSDAFVKAAGGNDYVGKVWPGDAVFPDLTDDAVRKWFGTNYKQFVRDGFSGFWDDMNEPSVFSEPTKTMPLDNVHRIQGDGFAPRTATHAEIHNVFGMENARATYEALQTLEPNERPYVMARASYAGGQRYGATWTGDNSSTWNHLKLSSTMLLNLGLSGFTFAGADVGGFAGSPSPDLLTKWVEIAAFQPIDRDHSDKKGRDQEIWVDGPEAEAVRRRFIETRYRLLPYFYTLAEEASRTGLPLMRPLFLEFPDVLPMGDPVDVSGMSGQEFLLGPDLLLAPAPTLEKVDRYRPYLPGPGWFDFWTGRPTETDGSSTPTHSAEPALITPALDRLPVYIRPGSIIPMQALVQSTDETPRGPLEIHVYPAPGRCEGSLYTDDGHSLAYKSGDYLRQKFSCTVTQGSLAVTIDAREGSYRPWWTQQEIVIHGWTSARFTTALADGSLPVSSRFDAATFTLHVLLAETPEPRVLRLTGYKP